MPMLRAQWQESDSGRQRKYYYITAAGRGLLESGKEEWSQFHGMLFKTSEALNA
jgi:DNA-binding PadR family transcriptional regulator